MRKLRILLALMVAVVASGCGSVKPAAAKVNATEISQDQLDEELDAIEGNTKYTAGIEEQGTKVHGAGTGTFDSQFVARVLTRQVLLELVHQEVVRRKVVPSAAELAKADEEINQAVGGPEIAAAFKKAYRDTLARRSAEVTKLQAALSSTPVDDAAVKKFYDENAAQFAQTCVSHILVSAVGADGTPDQQANVAQADQLRAEATRLRAEIDSGADFAALAAANSKDAGSREKGGDLSCGPAGRFVEPFELGMAALAVGEVSQPVQTPFGFHLIKVTERKTQSLQEAEPEIRQRLLQPTQEEFTNFMRETVGKAKISVNPRYGKFDKTGQNPAIVPPEAPSPPAGAGTDGSLPTDSTPNPPVTSTPRG